MRLLLALLIQLASNQNLALASEDTHPVTINPLAQTPLPIPEYELSALPFCTLDLMLTGTILGTGKQALISVNGHKDLPFSPNQIIHDKVVLIDVHPRAAVISNNGVLEKLGLRNGVGLQKNTAATHGMTPSASPVKVKENTHPFKNDHPSTARYKFLGLPFAPADVFTQAKVVSESDGLQIIETVPGGVYEHMGLQSGDKIIAVNGESVTSLLEVFNSIQKEKGAKKATTTLIRDGDFYNIEIDPEKGVEFTLIADTPQNKK